MSAVQTELEAQDRSPEEMPLLFQGQLGQAGPLDLQKGKGKSR